MNRRAVISLIGGAAAWPVMARAQQAALPVIGFVSAGSLDGYSERLRGYRQGLKETGFVEGENVTIEYRWADNQVERLPGLIADLVRRRVAVIAAPQTAGALAAKAATATVPIIFVIGSDPVELGLVASLNRPGGNLTGINFFMNELTAKRLELLRELVPGATQVAVLSNPASGPIAEIQRRDLETAARAMGVQIKFVSASTRDDIHAAFDRLQRERADALFVSSDPFFNNRRVQLTTLAARHALPASYSARDVVEAGGLMSYGPDIIDAFRQIGVYTGRALRGEKPADLPVQQPTKLELVINLTTAKVLGLTVPPSLLATADEVIE
jgi:putative ABC transport system substrate-binding protein